MIIVLIISTSMVVMSKLWVFTSAKTLKFVGPVQHNGKMYTVNGPINRHLFNRHMVDFEKNSLCYLILSRKNKSCLCYLISEKSSFIPQYSSVSLVFFLVRIKFSAKILLYQSLRRSYTLWNVLIANSSLITRAFWPKNQNFEVLKFNRHLGINRHLAKNRKNRGVC